MLKGVISGIVLTLVVAALVGFGLLHSGLIPANADATPGPIETWMAKTSLHATLRREAPTEPNPVALTDPNLLEGVDLYARNCAVCHGDSRGAAAPSPIAKGLYEKPPQLATDGVEDDPDGVSFWKIKHGIRLTAMPAFRDTLTDQQMWALALFVDHMDKLPPPVQQAWQQVRNWPVDAK